MWSLILLLGSPVTTFLHFLLALRKELLFLFHSTQWGSADLPLALSPASFPACDNTVAALMRQQRMLNIYESIKIDLGGFIKELSKHSGNLKKPFWDCSQASQVKVWQPPAILVSKWHNCNKQPWHACVRTWSYLSNMRPSVPILKRSNWLLSITWNTCIYITLNRTKLSDSKTQIKLFQSKLVEVEEL